MKLISNGYTSMARVWATNLLVLLKSMPDTWTFKEALNKYVMMPEQIMWRDSRGITLHEIRNLLIRISLEEEGMGLNEIQREDLDDWFSGVGRDIRSTTSREAGDCLALPDTRNTSGLKPQQERPTVEASGEGAEYYQKAIDAGIIERDGDGYKKKGITKAQLAYFLQRVFTPDATGRDGRVFPETRLNELFKEKRLGEAVRKLADNKKTGGKPRGYKKIDILFESEQP